VIKISLFNKIRASNWATFAEHINSDMKKTHLILLVLVIAGIVGMSFFIKDLTTYETFASAANKKEKFVVVKVKLDKKTPIEYNQLKDPNLTVFYALDADGNRSKIIYKNAKPTDIERSEGLDLNGYMRGDHFECTKLQMKCPSKYKEDMKAAEKNLSTNNSTTEYK
jgi:cytochrome c-type biogenesis protein CcmE